MSKTIKARAPMLPFFRATHRLMYKPGKSPEAITVEVMAVYGGGDIVQLYQLEERDAAAIPDWRAIGDTMIDGVTLQRDRKVVKSAVAIAIDPFIRQYLLVEGDDMLALCDDGNVRAVDATGELTTPAPAADDEDVDMGASVDDRATDGAEPSDDEVGNSAEYIAHVNGAEDVDLGDDVTAETKPRKVGGVKGHRAGSVMGMTIDELKAEWTKLTGRPAASSSVHYMRKMVTAARRGATLPDPTRAKGPRLGLTADQAAEILEVFRGQGLNMSTPTVAALIAIAGDKADAVVARAAAGDPPAQRVAS